MSIYNRQMPAAPAPAPSSPFSPITTPLSAILDILQRPLSATTGGVLALQRGQDPVEALRAGITGEARTSWEDVLREAGVEPGTSRNVAGLGLDLIADPLNFLPVSKVVEKGAALAKPLGKLPIVEDLAKKFIPFAGLPEDYQGARRLLDSEKQFVRHEALTNAIRDFKGLTPEQRTATSFAIEKGRSANPIIEAARAKAAQNFDTMFDREVAEGVMDPARRRENYVTLLLGGPQGRETFSALQRRPKELAAANRFNRPRTFESLKQALAAGKQPEVDIAKIQAIREYTGRKAGLHTNFIEKVTQNPEWALPDVQAPADWVKIQLPAEAKLKGLLDNYAFDPVIAKDLTKLLDVGKARGEIARMFDNVTSVWKGYATVLKPGFHARNLYSNVFNSWLGGMSAAAAPKRYAESIAWNLGKRPKMVGKFSSDVVDEAMRRYGVEGVEFGSSGLGDIGERIEEELAGKLKPGSRLNPLSKEFSLARVGRTVGSTIEDVSRRALFLDQVHKGASLEDAALHVKKYLFDYSELTDFERNVLRRAIPFYTWIRKNLPLQLESLAKHPEKFAAVGKVSGAIEQEVPEEDRVPVGSRPEYLQELGGIQLPIGGPNATFLNPNLPYQDINKLPISAKGIAASGIKGLQDLGSMLNPLLKAGIEWGTNKDLFRNRPLYDEKVGPSQMVPAPEVVELLASANPLFAEALGARLNTRTQRWEIPASTGYGLSQVPVLTSLGRATTSVNPQSGADDAAMLDFLTGIKTIPQTPQQRARDMKYRRSRAKAERTAQMRDRRNLQKSDLDSLYDAYLAGAFD